MKRPASPVAPTRILDEDERMVEFPSEEDAPMLKRLSSPKGDDKGEVFVIDSVLGAGAVNCAHLIRNKEGVYHVLRLAYLPNLPKWRRSNDGVLRGLELVHALQAYRALLGPSLVQETSRYRVFDETEENAHFVGQVCPHIRKSQSTLRTQNVQGNRFGLQHLEFLSGGAYHLAFISKNKLTDQDRHFGAFSLMWFLAVAQRTFDLGHHDLKAENIVFRELKQPAAFTFTVDGRAVHFKTRFVPVIIDYDRATVNVSLDEHDRHELGTYYTTSPDTLLYWLCKHNGIPYTMPYNRDAHDWWSLGATLLGTYQRRLWSRFESVGAKYAKHVLSESRNMGFRPDQRARNEEYLQALFYSCCIASIIAGTKNVRPPSEWYPYTQALFPPTWTFDPDGYEPYNDLFVWVYRQHNYEMTHMMKRMLSWNPSARNHGGDPMEYVRHFANNYTSQPQEAHVSYAYQIADSRNIQAIRLEEYPLLKTPMIETCVGCANAVATHACSCCNEGYCGVECQEKEHVFPPRAAGAGGNKEWTINVFCSLFPHKGGKEVISPFESRSQSTTPYTWAATRACVASGTLCSSTHAATRLRR